MVETEVSTRKNFFKFKTFYLQINSCVIIKVQFFINCNSFLNHFNFLNILKKLIYLVLLENQNQVEY